MCLYVCSNLLALMFPQAVRARPGHRFQGPIFPEAVLALEARDLRGCGALYSLFLAAGMHFSAVRRTLCVLFVFPS